MVTITFFAAPLNGSRLAHVIHVALSSNVCMDVGLVDLILDWLVCYK